MNKELTNYVPCGPEWEAELMKWNKKDLIGFLRKVLQDENSHSQPSTGMRDPDLIHDLIEYFESRADADGSSEGYTPNEEMQFSARLTLYKNEHRLSSGLREALGKILDEIGRKDYKGLSNIFNSISSIARKALSPSHENECKWSDSDVKKFLEDYRVANMDCYLNPVIWFDKLNDEK